VATAAPGCPAEHSSADFGVPQLDSRGRLSPRSATFSS